MQSTLLETLISKATLNSRMLLMSLFDFKFNKSNHTFYAKLQPKDEYLLKYRSACFDLIKETFENNLFNFEITLEEKPDLDTGAALKGWGKHVPQDFKK